MDILQFVFFSIIIFSAYFIQGVTGFGSAIFALPLASIFLPLNAIIPTLLVFSVMQNTSIVVNDRKYIKRDLIKIISLILIGVPFGIILFNKLPEDILKILLSLMIIYISISSFLKMKTREDKPKNEKSPIDYLYLFFGGCIHGAFTTGGPLIVIYFVKRIHDKKVFRVTMCFIWMIINILLIIQRMIEGWYTTRVLMLIGCGAFFVIIGTYFGNKVHNHISEEKFLKVSYVILFCTGISLLINTIY